MKERSYRTSAIIFVAALVLACAPLFAPPASPSSVPVNIDTIVAQTAGAAFTQTAAFFSPVPTITLSPIPSQPASVTPSPTVTFVFLLPTFTPLPTATPLPPTLDPKAPGKNYDCGIVKKNFSDQTVFERGEAFDMIWTVINSGKAAWDSGSADYHFLSGATLHTQPAYDFSETVLPGDKTNIVVSMEAPKKPGTYTTRWQITVGKINFCTMEITIVVE